MLRKFDIAVVRFMVTLSSYKWVARGSFQNAQEFMKYGAGCDVGVILWALVTARPSFAPVPDEMCRVW